MDDRCSAAYRHEGQMFNGRAAGLYSITACLRTRLQMMPNSSVRPYIRGLLRRNAIKGSM
jgi:hypothetical protein